MGKTIAEVSEDTLKLQAYLEKQKNGAELSYMRIEHDTGVVMDSRGKGYLRTALRRAKLESSTERNVGIVLADSKNAMGIIVNKLQKIDRTVKRGEKTHKNIQEQFFHSLTPEKQREILYIGAVFGAIRVAAENGKVIYSKKPREISTNITIPMPDI